jgi:hypothetical protein
MQVDMKVGVVGVLVDKRMVEVEQVVEVVVDMMVGEVVLELGQVDMTEVEEVVVVLADKMALEEVQGDKVEVLEVVTPLVEKLEYLVDNLVGIVEVVVHMMEVVVELVDTIALEEVEELVHQYIE